MKKIALLLAVFIMCAGLYACDENKQESKPTGSITVMVTDAVKEYAGTWVALGPEESTIVLNPNGTAVVDEKDYGGRAFWWGEHASIPERLCIEDDSNNLRLINFQEQDGQLVMPIFNKFYVKIEA